jgi:hypothetical protein
MLLKSVLMCAASLYLFVLVPAVTAAPSNDRCGFPYDLRDEILKKYPGTKVVSVEDLSYFCLAKQRKRHLMAVWTN